MYNIFWGFFGNLRFYGAIHGTGRFSREFGVGRGGEGGGNFSFLRVGEGGSCGL